MGEEIQNPEVTGLEHPTSEIELYAQDVMNEMVRNNIQPTPANFAAYFDKMLDDRPADFRKRILKILEIEDDSDIYKHQTAIEQHIKGAFANLKKFMQIINTIYKNLHHLENLIGKHQKELEAVSDKNGLKKIIDTVEKEVKSINSFLKDESKIIKSTYENTYKIIQETHDMTIYDDKYGVYKRGYFIKKLKQEIKLINEFHHESTILAIQVCESTLKKLNNAKSVEALLKTVAKLILKTSRRNDIVSIYDKNLFTMLMKHTSIDAAKKASERLKELINDANFFLGDKEIDIDIHIGISRVDPNRDAEETIDCAIEAVSINKKNGKPFGICPKDEETQGDS